MKKFIESFDKRRISQFLFLVTFARTILEDEMTLKILCREFAGLDFETLRAEIVFELAPDEFRPRAERFARKYFQEKFGERQVTLRKRNGIQKINGNDYTANWKKYLVNFSAQQFEYFKAIVRGRTDTSIIAEAVEQVMLEGKNKEF